MSDAIEAACAAYYANEVLLAKWQGSPLRTPEWRDLDDEYKLEYRETMRAAIAAYRDSEVGALRAQVATHENAMEACRLTIVDLHSRLADCQAVIRARGHDWGCLSKICGLCGCLPCNKAALPHAWIPGPCSDACGHDRTTGEKA